MDEKAFEQGFIDKCAEFGIDANELVKHALVVASKGEPTAVKPAIKGVKKEPNKPLTEAKK